MDTTSQDSDSDIYELLQIDNFKVKCIKNDLVITPYLKTGNLWGKNMEVIIKELYEPDTNMIDIGAHIGTFTLIMSKYISKNSKIFSFEPVFYNLLEYNVNNNNLQDNVVIYNIGLSDRKTNCNGFLLDFGKKESFGCFSFEMNRIVELKFDSTINKDNLYINFEKLDSFGFKNISFIKIDVEYFEKKILEGGVEFLSLNKPAILIELFLITPILKIYDIKGNICEYSEKEKEVVKDNTFYCFSLLSILGYICFPIIPASGEFLFIHKSKTNQLNKLIKILSLTNFQPVIV